MQFSPQAPTVDVSVLRLKRLLLVCPSLCLFFVSVLCVLRVFVVENPLSVAVLHRSSFIPHRSHRVAARKSTTPCLLGARSGHNVGHQYGPFSALHASPISVGRLPSHDIIFSMS